MLTYTHGQSHAIGQGDGWVEELPKTRVVPAVYGLDSFRLGFYKPPTFRQAVSFLVGTAQQRASTHKAQTLPLTADVSGV